MIIVGAFFLGVLSVRRNVIEVSLTPSINIMVLRAWLSRTIVRFGAQDANSKTSSPMRALLTVLSSFPGPSFLPLHQPLSMISLLRHQSWY